MESVVRVSYMYRDGCNYKTSNEVVFANNLGLTAEQVEGRFNNAGIEFGHPIIFDDYGLTGFGFDSLSPVSDEFEHSPNEYDHPYHEIISVEVEERPHPKKCFDITEVIEGVRAYDSERAYKERLREAIAYHTNRAYILRRELESSTEGKK